MKPSLFGNGRGVLDVFVVQPGRRLNPRQLIIRRHLEPDPGLNQEWVYRGGFRVEGLQLLPREFQVQDVGVDGVGFTRLGPLGVGRQPDGLAQWQVGKNLRRYEGAFPGHQVKVIAVAFHLVARHLPDLPVLEQPFPCEQNDLFHLGQVQIQRNQIRRVEEQSAQGLHPGMEGAGR